MLSVPPLRRVVQGAFGVAFVAIAVWVSFATVFFVRHALAIRNLTRGVGDTTFYTAAGKPWFRMVEERHDVPLAQISPNLRRAVIATEDHRFYRHPGLDPIALVRATFRNVREPGTVEGGSTLTQQLARTLFLSNQRTYGRKLKEAALALMLEAQLSKDQILELYLNRIYLGGDLYGVEPMSRRLFGKPAKDVTLAEAAIIAGIIRAPSALSPWSRFDAAQRRSHLVLSRMREEGHINEREERLARSAGVRPRSFTRAGDARAGYAKEYLRQEFRNLYGGDHPPDWQVRTTFVPEVQDAAERAVLNGLRRINQRGLQAALVAIDPARGTILAMVGGRDYAESTFNRARRSRRQPGSAFKPLVFAAALERGFSPVSELSGLASMQPMGREEWAPRNARGDTPDVLTLRGALIESNNRAAVALLERIGHRHVLGLAGQAGLADLPDVPSLALGTGLVSPLNLTAAFAMFPNGGLAVAPHGVIAVLDGAGQSAYEYDEEPERTLSPEAAFQMVSMLEDVVDRGTASGARASGLRHIGGKTGTTDDFKDAWFVGFSSSVVAGVWVGFDQPAQIGPNAYGHRIALPIWSEFMQRTSRLLPAKDFQPPTGMTEEPLCRMSYLRPVEDCPTYTEYFKRGDTIPGRLCTIHRGTLKQRAQRAVEGFFKGLGSRIAGIFRK